MKIALMRITGRNCYECDNGPSRLVTNWYDVSEPEYEQLRRYIFGKHTGEKESVILLHEPYDEKATWTSVQEALEYASKQEQMEESRRKEAEKKKREKEKGKKLRKATERKKLFEELKKEFGE